MPTSDADLTRTIREAGRHSRSAQQALEELYRRHGAAVLSYARTCCRDAHTAEDLASEAFASTLQAIRAGRGPEDAWRPYLLAVVRRNAAAWARTARRTELSPEFERWLEATSPKESSEERALRREEDDLVLRGFRSLPERWQAVLWHTHVEGESAQHVGKLLGIGPSGVSSLAARAREGLREAYLTAHLESSEDEACRRFSRLIATTVRRSGRRPSKDLARHLDTCDRCRRARRELTELNAGMRAVLPGAVLLWAAPSYLASRFGEVGASGSAPGMGALATAKASPLGAGVLAGTAVAVVVGGFLLLLPDRGDGDGTAAPLAPAPSDPAEPSPTPEPQDSPATAAPESPTPAPTTPTTQAAPSPTTDPWLPEAALATWLRIASTDQCMTISTPSGAQPYEATCDGSAQQSWDLVRDGAGRIQLRNQASLLCLTYPEDLPDGAEVRQQPCGEATRGQWWDFWHSPNAREIAFIPMTDSLKRLGLNDWHSAGQGEAHDPAIGVTANYYGSPSLYFRLNGKLWD